MARGSILATLAVVVALASQCFAQSSKAKNVIIFMGDGTGVSSLNAASIYGYDKPQSLYIQSFPGVALADTSTATQWVTDGGAGATAIATGVKILWTADHSYDLPIKGEALTETLKKNEGKKITSAVSLKDEHTAEEVPVMAIGPGSERVHGFISNTDVFHILMAVPGWQETTQYAAGGTQ
jgi:alkaline phosphatase